MPWTSENYPNTFNNFTVDVRDKAIEIANALVEDGYEEDRSIRIATAQAKDWAQRRDMQVWVDQPQKPNQHVVPHDQQWAVRAAGSERASKVLPTKEAALDRAREIARNQGVDIVIHYADGSIEDVVTPQ